MAITRTTPKTVSKGGAGRVLRSRRARTTQRGRTQPGKPASQHSTGSRVGRAGKKGSRIDLATVFGVSRAAEWGERLRATRSALGLDQPGFGHLIGCSTRSLVEYEKGTVPKGAVLVRFIELGNLLDLLGTVIPDGTQLEAWMHSRVPDLDNRTPLEIFAAGESAKLYALVYGAIAGVAQ